MYMLQSIYFKLTSLLLWDFPHFRRNNGALCTNPFINQSRYLFYDYPISAVDCSSSVAYDNAEEVPKQVNKAFPRQLIYLSASILIYLPKCIVNLNASRGFSPRTSAIQKSITPLPRPIHKFLPFWNLHSAKSINKTQPGKLSSFVQSIADRQSSMSLSGKHNIWYVFAYLRTIKQAFNLSTL